MLAVTIEATVRLVPKPKLARCITASFDDTRIAGDAVAAVIAAGIIPRGLETMDKPMTAAVEDCVHAGYDRNAVAILLEVSKDEAQRLTFWSGHRNAFPASGRIGPGSMGLEGTIPRKRLVDILETSEAPGGTVTGEHGAGIERLGSMCVPFSPEERTRSPRAP